jgi:hypothetical protein
MGRFRRSVGKALSVDIYKRGGGRFALGVFRLWPKEGGCSRAASINEFKIVLDAADAAQPVFICLAEVSLKEYCRGQTWLSG